MNYQEHFPKGKKVEIMFLSYEMLHNVIKLRII